MSSSTAKLNQSFDDWYGAKSIVEEELKVIAKAVEKIRFSSHLRDAFTGHLLDVHRQWCGACPPAPAEAGHSVGGPEKDVASRRTCTVHTQAGHAHAVAAYTPMEKTSVRYVSTCTQTTDLTSPHMDAHGAGNESSGSSGPSLMSSHLEAQEMQADVNRTTENQSTENLKDISTDFIKVEAPEDEAFQDVPVPVLLRLEEDHHDFDVDGGREDTPSWQRIEEELPSQLIESDEQSRLERRVSDQPIKDERDCEELQDLDMPGCSSEVMSHHGHVAEMQLARSVHPIKPEMDSQTHTDLDVAGSSRGAVFHQGIMEELPLDRPDETWNASSSVNFDVPMADDVSSGQCDAEFNNGVGTHTYRTSSEFAHKSNTEVRRRKLALPTSYTCDCCIYRCPSKQLLKIHTWIHHRKRLYSCDSCESTFSDAANFERHLTEHTAEKPYECSLCRKRYKRFSYLRIHSMTHTGEKPFCCDICEYRCSTKGLLTSHMKKHTGERPYHCSVCDKRFKQSHSLKRHMTVHAGQNFR